MQSASYSLDQFDILPQSTRESLQGANVKLRRAASHFSDLKKVTETYFDSGPFRVEKTETAEGDLSYVVRVLEPIPKELSAIAGDVLHNLRAVLDHLAWACVEWNGSTPTRRTSFPISKTKSAFRRRLHKDLSGAGPKALRLVKLLRPYKAGNPVLWKLHWFDIVDKHRLLMVVGAAYQHVTLSMQMNVPWEDEPVEFPPFALNPADPLFPLKDGDELYRVRSQARGSGIEAKEPEFSFRLHLAEGTFADAVPLFEYIDSTLSHVGRVVILFGNYVLV